MYKIITDISILNEINNAAKLKEGKQEVNYCEIQKHPIKEEYAIPIIEGILRGYNLPFIDELLTGLIETLPDDWEWPYTEQSIRIVIPNYLILKEAYLKALIQYCDENQVINIVNETHTTVYVSYILSQHQALFDMYEEIIIEIK